ncbi:MAG: diguanylate cyclase [Burkholderiaceae bacterium]|jgi:diguanylate cyclase (GGDEF)-like protein
MPRSDFCKKADHAVPDFLPTQPPEMAPGTAPLHPKVDLLLPLANPVRKARLLVVDDQPIHLQVLHRALSVDYQMFMATSGEQALRVCQEQHPDLVLLDVVMPDMDGFEVLQRIKTHPDTTDIPVIFVTAHGGDEIETQCLQAGAVDFIPKPVNPNVVKARVKTHLTLKFQSDFLRDMAFMDGLTGVSNRRHFDERLAVEWGRAQRSGSALSLVLLDVDFFKAYNDHYGHQAGDDCLRQIAAALKAELRRPTDLVARYGGEEFVCLLPDTGHDDALAMAERMLRAVRALGLAHLFSDVAPVVTVSLGVATRDGADTGSRAAYLLALADAQLYQAKRSGRAQVCGARLPLPV